MSSLAFFFDGRLYVGTGNAVVELGNGNATTVVRPRGFYSPDLFAVGGNGGCASTSIRAEQEDDGRSCTRVPERLLAPNGRRMRMDLRRRRTAASSSERKADKLLRTRSATGSCRPSPTSAARFHAVPFQEVRVAVAPDGTIYTDTFVGNGYTKKPDAAPAVTADRKARLLRTTTPLAATLPPGMTTGWPSPFGGKPFDATARRRQLPRCRRDGRLPVRPRPDPQRPRSWWSGFCSNQIDGRCGWAVAASTPSGRRRRARTQPRSFAAVAPRSSTRSGRHRRRTWRLLRSVSHMLLPRPEQPQALLYWQHT